MIASFRSYALILIVKKKLMFKIWKFFSLQRFLISFMIELLIKELIWRRILAGAQHQDVHSPLYLMKKRIHLISFAQNAIKIIVSIVELNGIKIWHARKIKSIVKFPKKIENSLVLLKGINSSNAHIVSFGLRKHRDVTAWVVNVVEIFATDVVMDLVNATFKNQKDNELIITTLIDWHSSNQIR